MLITHDYIALAESLTGTVVIWFNVSTQTKIIIITRTDNDCVETSNFIRSTISQAEGYSAIQEVCISKI